MNASEKFPLLCLLIDTMEEVVSFELPFHMKDFYYDYGIADQAEDIHTCGTPACVVGYGAVDPKIQKHLKVDILHFRAAETAEDIAEILLDELGDLGYSIFCSIAYERHLHAADELPETDLDFEHLHKDEPSPAETLKYMKHVLAFKVRELEAEEQNV